MGWANCGEDSKGRPIGYAHEGTCDYPGCTVAIDRGLSYVCGDMHGNDEYSCESYFCETHRSECIYVDGNPVHVCEQCGLAALKSDYWTYDEMEGAIIPVPDTWEELVTAFHRKYGSPVGTAPVLSDPDRLRFRENMIRSELDELLEAIELGDLVKFADGLGDIVYTAVGAAVETGIPLDVIVREIHRSNMTKDVPSTPGGKGIKGDKFEPPNLVPILMGSDR